MKILEASAAVDGMREAASAIDQLLSSVNEALLISIEGEEPKESIDKSSPIEQVTNSTLLNSNYQKEYEQVWINIQEGEYEEAALVIIELRKVESIIKTDILRAERILSQLCNRELYKFTFTVSHVIQSIKAKSILSGKGIEEEFKEFILKFNPPVENLDGTAFSTIIKKIYECTSGLGLCKENFISNLLMNQLSLSGPVRLDTCVKLVREEDGKIPFLSQLALEIFKDWLKTIPSSPSIPGLFDICKVVTSSTIEGPLPNDWIVLLKSHLLISIPIDMSLVMAPLVGCPTLTRIPPSDPETMEKLFVPMGLPRVLKLV